MPSGFHFPLTHILVGEQLIKCLDLMFAHLHVSNIEMFHFILTQCRQSKMLIRHHLPNSGNKLLAMSKLRLGAVNRSHKPEGSLVQT
jgi:hypothetical protein